MDTDLVQLPPQVWTQPKIASPKEIIRTTVDELGNLGEPESGIYILAYVGKVIYVGKASAGINARLRQHIVTHSLVGQWLDTNKDWANIRLDILVPPDNQDEKAWLRRAEVACINQFSPLLNSQLG